MDDDDYFTLAMAFMAVCFMIVMFYAEKQRQRIGKTLLGAYIVVDAFIIFIEFACADTWDTLDDAAATVSIPVFFISIAAWIYFLIRLANSGSGRLGGDVRMGTPYN